jgi:tRNA-dihydrouridine synthase A
LNYQDYRFSTAPMMDWTDRHCRVFRRLLTRRRRLYTGMLPTGALLHGDRARLPGFNASELLARLTAEPALVSHASMP